MPSGGTALRSTATLSVFTAGPGRLRHHLHAGRSRVEQHVRPLEHSGSLDGSFEGDGLYLDVEPGADELARLLALLRLAGSDGHVGAVLGQQPRRTLADRTGSREHRRPFARQVAQGLLDLHYGGHGRGVGAVGVQHDRDAEVRRRGRPEPWRAAALPPTCCSPRSRRRCCGGLWARG